MNDIKQLQDTDNEAQGDSGSASQNQDGQSQWLIDLKKKVTMYMDALPTNLQTMKRVGSLVKNPLFRFLERECSVLSALL